MSHLTELPRCVIIQGRRLETQQLVTGEEGNAGRYVSVRDAIQIIDGMSRWSTWETYGHELWHAVLDHNGLDNLFNHKQVEALCEAFGALLAELIVSGQITLPGVKETPCRKDSSRKP